MQRVFRMSIIHYGAVSNCQIVGRHNSFSKDDPLRTYDTISVPKKVRRMRVSHIRRPTLGVPQIRGVNTNCQLPIHKASDVRETQQHLFVFRCLWRPFVPVPPLPRRSVVDCHTHVWWFSHFLLSFGTFDSCNCTTHLYLRSSIQLFYCCYIVVRVPDSSHQPSYQSIESLKHNHASEAS